MPSPTPNPAGREDHRIVHPGDARRVLRLRLRAPAEPHAARAARGLVVAVPGYLSGKDRYFHPLLEERLAAKGFWVVSMDLSGSGYGDDGLLTELEAFAHNTYAWELEDIHRALLWARSHPQLHGQAVGLFGHSRGAAMALAAAAEDRAAPAAEGAGAVGALVLWSAPARVGRYRPERLAHWRATGSLPVELGDGRVVHLTRDALDGFEPLPPRLDLLRVARDFHVPTLLVAGERDRAVEPGEVAELAAALPRKEVRTVARAGHNFGAREHPPFPVDERLEEAVDATVSWFERHLSA